MTQVFLGGTCNGSKWRERLIPMLDSEKISYFNPVVEDWGVEARLEKSHQKNLSDYLLFVFTPKMEGVYAVAEVAEAVIAYRPATTIFCVLPEDEGQVWDECQSRSMKAVYELVESRGARCFESLEEVADYINRKASYSVDFMIETLEAKANSAYAERNKCVAALSKAFPSYLARHPDEDETWDDDWRWIVFIDLPTGQVSWHIHDSEKHLFDHLSVLPNQWDGHDTEEKYRRLEALSDSGWWKRKTEE